MVFLSNYLVFKIVLAALGRVDYPVAGDLELKYDTANKIYLSGGSLDYVDDVTLYTTIGEETTTHIIPQSPRIDFNNETKLTGEATGNFGSSVSIDGDYLAITDSFYHSNDYGKVYIYHRSGTTWSLQNSFQSATSSDYMNAVALSGDYVMVGVRYGDNVDTNAGEVLVYKRSGTTWTNTQTLTASDGANGDNFGGSITLKDNCAVVGTDNVSGAYVFTLSNGTWSETQLLTTGTNSDLFGHFVNLSDTDLLIGARGVNSLTGTAYIYTNNGGTFTQQAQITPDDLVGTDWFGQTGDIFGDYACVCAPYQNTSTGAAYIFKRSGKTWTQQQKLTASNSATNTRFGYGVHLMSDDTVIIGAYNDDAKGANAGAAYLFQRTGDTWSEIKIIYPSDIGANDFFGRSISSSETDLVISGPTQDNATGNVYLFPYTKTRNFYITDAGKYSVDATIAGLKYKTNEVEVTGTPTSSKVTQISTGDDASGVLTQDGFIYMWGLDTNGALGQGTNGVPKNTPVKVKGVGGTGYLGNIIKITRASYATLALASDGTLYAWGNNDYGIIGNGTSGNGNHPLTPVEVSYSGDPISKISGGRLHAGLVTTTGKVYCWGQGTNGQIGDNQSASNRTVPTQVVGVGNSGTLAGIRDITCGDSFTHAIKDSDGSVYAWGKNTYGMLGDGTITDRNTPVPVILASDNSTVTGITQISSGGDFALFLKSDGTVYGAGYNLYGQIGNGSITDADDGLVQVQGVGGSGNLTGITQIATCDSTSLALKSDGTMYSWGRNNNGQNGLGTVGGTNPTTPVAITLLTGVNTIAGEGRPNHFIASKLDGSIFCWGKGDSGQIGDGTNTADQGTPTQVLAGAGPSVDGKFNLLTEPRLTFDGYNKLSLLHGLSSVSSKLFLGSNVYDIGTLTSDLTIETPGLYRGLVYDTGSNVAYFNKTTVGAITTPPNTHGTFVQSWGNNFWTTTKDLGAHTSSMSFGGWVDLRDGSRAISINDDSNPLNDSETVDWHLYIANYSNSDHLFSMRHKGDNDVFSFRANTSGEESFPIGKHKDGALTHFVVTTELVSGTYYVSLYSNGQFIKKKTWSSTGGSSVFNVKNFRIGKHDYTESNHGSLSRMFFYSGTLSDSDVNKIYHNYVPKTTGNCVLKCYFPFQNGLNDESGNNNHLVEVGTTNPWPSYTITPEKGVYPGFFNIQGYSNMVYTLYYDNKLYEITVAGVEQASTTSEAHYHTAQVLDPKRAFVTGTGGWKSQNSASLPAYLTVKLPEAKYISNMFIRERESNGGYSGSSGTGSNAPREIIIAWEIEASTDGTTWSSKHSDTGIGNSGKDFALDTPGTFQYWRIKVSSAQNYYSGNTFFGIFYWDIVARNFTRDGPHVTTLAKVHYDLTSAPATVGNTPNTTTGITYSSNGAVHDTGSSSLNFSWTSDNADVFSVSFLAKNLGSSQSYFVRSTANSGAPEFEAYLAGSTYVWARSRNDSLDQAYFRVDTSDWTHYVYVHSPVFRGLYINGALVSRRFSTLGGTSGQTTFYSSTSNMFNAGGVLSKFRAFSNVLDQHQIQELYDYDMPDIPIQPDPITFDGYNKLTLSGITNPTSKIHALPTGAESTTTYDIGSATNIYIESAGTYTAEMKGSSAFALDSNVVSGTISFPSRTSYRYLALAFSRNNYENSIRTMTIEFDDGTKFDNANPPASSAFTENYAGNNATTDVFLTSQNTNYNGNSLGWSDGTWYCPFHIDCGSGFTKKVKRVTIINGQSDYQYSLIVPRLYGASSVPSTPGLAANWNYVCHVESIQRGWTSEISSYDMEPTAYRYIGLVGYRTVYSMHIYEFSIELVDGTVYDGSNIPTVSSNMTINSGSAANTIDGDFTNKANWNSASTYTSASQQYVYLKVDLGSAKKVKHVRVWSNYTGTYTNGPNSMNYYGSSTNTSSTDAEGSSDWNRLGPIEMLKSNDTTEQTINSSLYDSKLEFDGYNKLSLNKFDPTSSTLKYGSNTYDLGTITNVYIAHPGTYSAEIKGATNFALSSNVTGGTISSEDPIRLHWNAYSSPASDSSGNSLTGTLNSVSDTSGAFTFDGSSSYIQLSTSNASDAKLQLAIWDISCEFYKTGSGTVGSWVDANAIVLITKGINTGDGGGYDINYGLVIDSNNKIKTGFEEAGSNQIGLVGTTTISNNQWYTARSTFDGTNLKVYLNGVLENSVTTTLVPASNDAGPLMVGAGRYTTSNTPAAYFQGRIKNVKINKFINNPSLTFDTYNKLTFTGLESGSTSNVTFDGNTYSIGTASNVYIENTGTYEAESKGTTTFALTKKQVSSSPSDTPADSATYNLKYTINRHPYLTYTNSRMTELSVVNGLGTHTWSKTGSFFNTDGQEYEYMFIGESSGTSTSTTVALPYSVTTTVVTGTSAASDFTNRIWNGSASTTSANEQQSCTPVSADSPGTSILEGYIEIQGTYTSAITPAYLLLGFTNGYDFSTSVTSGYGGAVKSLEVIVDGMTYFNIVLDQYAPYGIAGTLLKHVTNISANKSLFAIKLPNKIPVPKLKFNDYKLSINGIKPTSSTLKYDSNTYEIGTATNIYVENTGDYSAEIGGAADFAFTSNTVSGTIKTIEPVITGGYFFGHALTYDGKLYGWGENSDGELGVGDSTDKTVPTLCTGIPQGDVVSIWDQSKRGESRWAKTRDGRIWVTGNHASYCLPGSSANFTTFTDVSAQFGDHTQPATSVVWASGSERATQVLMENGDVWSFGNDAGAAGVLGQGASPTSDRTPRKLNDISNVTKIVYNGDFVVALDSSNVVWMWGSNNVGGGSTNGWGPYNTPTNIMGTGTANLTSLLVSGETVTDIENGSHSMFAITSKGTVYATGKNVSGQLGQGGTTAKTSSDGWVKIEYFTSNTITVNRLYTGQGEPHVFADTSDGWYCWGENGVGQLGLGDTTDKTSPVKWTNVSNIKTFGVGESCHYAIAEDGKYYAWGSGGTNRRGDNDTGAISYPKYINALPNILAPSFDYDGYDKIHSNKNYFTKDGKITRVNVSFELGGPAGGSNNAFLEITLDKDTDVRMAGADVGDGMSQWRHFGAGYYATLLIGSDGYIYFDDGVGGLGWGIERKGKWTIGEWMFLSGSGGPGSGSNYNRIKINSQIPDFSSSGDTSIKFNKGAVTYDAGTAKIITVSDPGTYDAQLSQGGVFSLKSATVPTTSSTGLYTWAFHHGNFDNAYGDGDILTARENGRFYADTPAYTGDIGTITSVSTLTRTQPTLVDNIAPGSHQGVAEYGGSAVYYQKSTTSTSYIYGFGSSGSSTILDIAYDWVEQVWKDVYIDVSTNSIHSSFGASASEASFAYSKASPKNPPVVYIYKSGLPGPTYGTGTLWAQFTNPYYEDTVSSTTYTFAPPSGGLTANVLMVAGGGGGGGVNAGGGGAGGLVYSLNESISTGSKTIVVGNGGNGGTGYNTGLSEIGIRGKDTTFLSYTASGGGGGGSQDSSATTQIDGGSGGGNNGRYDSGVGGSSTQNTYSGKGFGNDGGNGVSDLNGGGGGGAGGAGTDGTGNGGTGGTGGIGKYYGYIFGTNYGDNGWFAGGGGGASQTGLGTIGLGGKGGGGDGFINTGSSDTSNDGQTHTGGGGGAAGYSAGNSTRVGGNGSSGIVLLQTNVATPRVNSEVKIPEPHCHVLIQKPDDTHFSHLPSLGNNNVHTGGSIVPNIPRADGSVSNVYYASSTGYFLAAQAGSLVSTVEGIFYPIEQERYDNILEIGHNSSHDVELEMASDGTAKLYRNHGATLIAAGTKVCFTVGKWHHIALTLDTNRNAVGYVNGYPVVSATYASAKLPLAREQMCLYRTGVTATFRKFLMYYFKTYNSVLNQNQILKLASSVGLGPKLEYDGLNTIKILNTEPGSSVKLFTSNVADTSNVFIVADPAAGEYTVPEAGKYYAEIKGTDTFTITKTLDVSGTFPLYAYPPRDGTQGSITNSSSADTWNTWTVSGAANGNGQYQARSNRAASGTRDAHAAFSNNITAGDGEFQVTHSNSGVPSAYGTLDLELPSAKTIRKYVIWTTDSAFYKHNSTTYTDYDPTLPYNGSERSKRRIRTWDIQGSNDGASWTTIHTVTDKPPSIYGDVHTISSPGSYQYYRLAWIANNTSRESTCIAELIYYGD